MKITAPDYMPNVTRLFTGGLTMSVRTIVVFLLTLIVVPAASAAVIRVPADQPTIQAGIDAAMNGDTVLVADGTWRGPDNRNLNFRGKAITVQSEGGPLNCIIDAEGSLDLPRRCVIFSQGEQYDTILRGFTLTGGFNSTLGGGISIEHSSPTITGNIIAGNTSTRGSGIGCDASGPRIEKNIFHDNGYFSSSYGGALYCEHSWAEVIDNLFLDNITNGPGGGAWVIGGPVLFEGNRFIGNASEGSGGGAKTGGALCLSAMGSDSMIRNNLFRGNHAEKGAMGSDSVIRNNLFRGNRADSGGALYCGIGDPVIADNRFQENMAVNTGGGLRCAGGSPKIERNRFTGNHASWGGAIQCSDNTMAHFDGCLVYGNRAGYSGGGMECGWNAYPEITGCTFAGNEALISHGGAINTHSGAALQIKETIFWGNDAPLGPAIAMGYENGGSNVVISYCDLEGGQDGIEIGPDSILTWGDGMIDANPLFASAALGDYFLGHLDAGQAADSPCIDAGDPSSPLSGGSTRTDLASDSGVIDMGFHWSTGWRLAAGPGPGPDNPPEVHLFLPCEGAEPVLSFIAYGVPRYGVNLAVGDLLGVDGRQIVTGPGPGAVFGPHVRAFESDGDPITEISFLAYGTRKWGVNVACGNLYGYYPGSDEIVTGAGPGAVFGPHVRAFFYDTTPVPGVSFLAYGTNKWGVNVACGDIDGDSCDEIITGAGPGAVFGPHVRGWNVDGLAAQAMPGVSFMAYGTSRWGVKVAAGDIDGDGIDELLTAPGPSPIFSAHVRGWDYDGTSVVPMPGVNFIAWEMAAAAYGATVGCSPDLDRDGRDEIVVGAGPDPDGASMIDIFRYDDSTCSRWFGVAPFPGLTHGATVAAGWLE